MMSGQPFLPLYFEEEDDDLWQVLAAIEPENRARLVKVALRQAFLGSLPPAETRFEGTDSEDISPNRESIARKNAHRENDWIGSDSREYDTRASVIRDNDCRASDRGDNERRASESGSYDRERSSNDAHKEIVLDFSLEDLFIPPSTPTTPTLPQAIKDRAVPDAVEQIPSCPTAIEQGTAQISPWENLLYNIIGTEDDQEVLTIFRTTNLQKERITTL